MQLYDLYMLLRTKLCRATCSVRFSYNSSFSACFFSRNNVFLSQQIRRNSISICFFSETNGPQVVSFRFHAATQPRHGEFCSGSWQIMNVRTSHSLRSLVTFLGKLFTVERRWKSWQWPSGNRNFLFTGDRQFGTRPLCCASVVQLYVDVVRLKTQRIKQDYR